MQYTICEKPIRTRNSEKVKEYKKFLEMLTTLPENQSARQTFQNKKAATNKASNLIQFEVHNHILKNLGYKLHVRHTKGKGNQFSIYFYATKIEKQEGELQEIG